LRDLSPDRLYRLLPGHMRALDVGEGRALQALMRVFGRELDLVETDIEALYDDLFIETCEPWVVPYIGDLVGARALREFGGGSLRAYVANTLSYRQAKGTLAVLEQLARDVTGWPVVGVEFFRRLIQSQNVNHVRGDNLATMSLRDADRASLTGGPFEAAAHGIDVRSVETGRYNIPNVGLFVWRIQSYSLAFAFDAQAGYAGGVVPAVSAIGPGFRHLDPLGRPIRLFNRQRTEAGLAQPGDEATMPAPLRIRPLAQDLSDLRAGRPGGSRWFLTRPVIQVRLDGAAVALANLYVCNLEDRDDGGGGVTWRRPDTAGNVLVDPVLGRLALHANDEGKTVEVAYAYGAPDDLGAGPHDRRASVAAWLGDVMGAKGDPPTWQIGVTRRAEEITADPDQGGPVVGSLAEAIEAWNAHAAAGDRGLIALMDSASYPEDLTTAARVIKLSPGAMLVIVAAGWPARPLDGGARRRDPGRLAPLDRRPHIASNLVVAAADGGALVLDGLLLEGRVVVAPGDLGRLEVRCSTLGAGAAALGQGLEVQAGGAGGNLRLSLRVERSICGLLALGPSAGDVTICESILGEDQVADGDPLAMPAVLDAPAADVSVGASTLFGKVAGRTLEADDSLFVGPLTIARRQQGCVRFSYLPETSRTPRRYRCTPDLQIAQAKERLGAAFTAADEQALRERIRPVFTSTLQGAFAFGQLALRCPPEIAEGAEGGAEMGALNSLRQPMRIANIRDALDEYLPFGLSAGLLFAT
jgi:hypothetical protein